MRRIGSRRSRLAVRQVEEFKRYFPDERFEVVYFDTSGDMDKVTSISMMEGSDFFTDALDKALLNGEIDMAIHSAKDLPDKIPDGITVVFITESIYPYDVLVGRLFPGAVVGTSSQRRKEQLRKYMNDLRISDIRGNIDERLEKLDNGEYDGIVAAGAGLIRLGLENRIAEVLPFVPHPMQGRLAVTVRSDDYGKGIFDWCRPG